MSKRLEDLAFRYNKKIGEMPVPKEMVEENYHISAFGFPLCPLITADSFLSFSYWGLFPFWRKNGKPSNEEEEMAFNAESETVFRRNFFRSPATYRRCIIPSTGYFEWRYNANKTITPYFIYKKDEDIFSLAGICYNWSEDEGNTAKSTFSVITTKANSLLSFIHNGGYMPYRMPGILRKEDEKKWLNPLLGIDEVVSCLRPIEDDLLDVYPLENGFLKKSVKDCSLLNRA